MHFLYIYFLNENKYFDDILSIIVNQVFADFCVQTLKKK